jgi:hypothetical protein
MCFTSTFGSQTTEVVTETFATVKTAEGVELTIEGELAAGSEVTMKDTSGQLVPAPEGRIHWKMELLLLYLMGLYLK